MLFRNGLLFAEAEGGESGGSGGGTEGESGGGSLLTKAGESQETQGTTPALLADPTKFKDMLSDEFRNSPVLKDYPDINALAKSHINLQRMVGGEKIPVPQEGWNEDQYGEFYTRLGRPPSPDGYEFKFPEGYQPQEDLFKGMVSAMHKAGLTKKQANEVVSKFAEFDVKVAREAQQAAAQQQSDALMTLKHDLGDKYDEEMNYARYGIQELGDKELVGFLEESGLGNSVPMAKLMSKVGKLLATDRATGSTSTGGPDDLNLTPAQAQAEINAILQDPEKNKAWLDANAPNHEAVVNRIAHLHKLAFDVKS